MIRLTLFLSIFICMPTLFSGTLDQGYAALYWAIKNNDITRVEDLANLYAEDFSDRQKAELLQLAHENAATLVQAHKEIEKITRESSSQYLAALQGIGLFGLACYSFILSNEMAIKILKQADMVMDKLTQCFLSCVYGSIAAFLAFKSGKLIKQNYDLSQKTLRANYYLHAIRIREILEVVFAKK